MLKCRVQMRVVVGDEKYHTLPGVQTRACMCMGLHMRVCVCVRVCMRGWLAGFITNNTISPPTQVQGVKMTEKERRELEYKEQVYQLAMERKKHRGTSAVQRM